ncbi:unnamed protein product [Rotaria sordida]|uniref:Uncharacterized protein n=1 Tax=Rotaria sordida TaxID=392033 RepID=A0A814QBH6_9BILA|nr:unnamed protein product [Rotaria sordida]
MNDHTNELPHNVAQLSQQYHSLEQLFQTKYDMVQQKVLKSTEEIKQCFKSYQNGLLEAHQTIISGIENAKQNAEGYLNRIYSELQTINVDIELTLAREAIFQSERMESILIQLNQIQEKPETYGITKDIELQIVIPKPPRYARFIIHQKIFKWELRSSYFCQYPNEII